MHSDIESRGFVERFVDSFFQEKNIKWMLIVGAAIVFGSSLMLVTKAWPGWTLTLKYLTILAYTGVIFASAEFSRRRLKLGATYRVLQALTMLLLPICFLSLTWLSAGTAAQSIAALTWKAVLLIPAAFLLWLASSRILDHWLCGRQTTFLVCFILLTLAGAVPVITSPIAAYVFVIVCWIVLTIGVLKINRHIFWLTETHRMPKVFGFLPIVILGLQFVVLVGTKAITAIPVPWIGFATVLVAATILMTARSIADIYRRRTGDLVRPWPWTIIVPLFFGLAVSVVGLGISMVGFSFTGTTTFALVPTAIVAAITYAVVASDTKDKVLAWASLIAIAIAYQCSPVFFADLVDWFRNSTASAINRDRVPISLYGITYLPLLGGLALTSFLTSRKDRSTFAKPIKHFVTAVGIGLYAFAATDIVSLFIVATVNIVMFLAYALAFQDRRYAAISLVSLIIAVGTCIHAGHSMASWYVDDAWVPTVLAGLACIMTFSKLPDRLINRIPLASESFAAKSETGKSLSQSVTRRIAQTVGCSLAIAMGVHWIAWTSTSLEPLSQAAIAQFLCLIASMIVFTIRVGNYWSSLGCWVMIGYASVRTLVVNDYPWIDGLMDAAVVVTIGLVATSVLANLIIRSIGKSIATESFTELRNFVGFAAPQREELDQSDQNPNRFEFNAFKNRLLAVFLPLADLSNFGLALAFGAFFAPVWLGLHLGMPLDGGNDILMAIASIAISAWILAMAIGLRQKVLGCLAAVILPISVTSVAITAGLQLNASDLMLGWSVVLAAEIVVCQRRLRYQSGSMPEDQLAGLVGIVQSGRAILLGMAVASCLSFDWTMRCVAIIAATTLWGRWFFTKLKFSSGKEDPQRLADAGDLPIVLSLQTLLAAAAIGGAEGWLPAGLLEIHSGLTLSITLLVSVIWLMIFQHSKKLKSIGEIFLSNRARDWTNVLRGLTMVLIAACLLPIRFSGFEMILVVLAISTLAIHQIYQAIRGVEERRVWAAIVLLAAGAMILYLQGVISFGVGISQFVLLGLGIMAFGVIEAAKRWGVEAAFDRPMSLIGNAMPAIVAVLAIVREFTDYLSASTALGAMALMLAAGIYFYRAIWSGRRTDAIGGVIIANLSLLFLWRSLGWFAPELYLVPIGISVFGLVEVLKDKLPTPSHNPLRYIAVLTVMSSPMFQVIGGSWIHMLVLMVISVFVILIAIGLRLRALVYAGSACLLVDLIAMVVRSTLHNLNLLWIVGVLLGIAVIALAAFCENHRDKLLARIRILSAELATWN